MATTTLSILVEAKNNATKALASVNKSLDAMQPAFQGMQKAGAIAFGTISVIAGKAIKDYAEAEKSSAQLKHAVIDVSHATQQQLEATSALADELERKGVLDGDNIKMGLAQLSTFGLSNKAVQALGGSLADLAVNQYGVSASGDQLSDTANMIAKALNGQFGVLEKSGIRFTEAQQHAIQFGTEMEKVDAINQGFAQNLKFTNDVALGTTDGQMAKAAVSAGNLSEALGRVLTPMVNQLATAVVPMLDKIQKWIEANPELTKNIVVATAAIAGILLVVGTLGVAIPAVTAGFTALAALGPILGAAITLATGPIGLMIVAIGLLVAGGVLLYKHWDEVKVKAIQIWDAIKQFLQENWQAILAIFTGGIGSIIALIVQNTDAIVGAWSMVWNTVKDTFFGIVDGIKNGIISTIDWITSKLNGAIALANQAIMLANKVPGVNIGTIPSIPASHQASGGIVSTPTHILAGEEGPEAIIPLNRLGRGGVGSITIQINGGTFMGTNSREVARTLGDMIIKDLQMSHRLG